MSNNHLDVSENDDVTIVRFKAHHLLLVDEYIVREIGSELDKLASGQDGCKLIVDFVGVEDLSNLMLGQLVKLRVKMATNRGKLVLCGLSPKVREFFDETMLSQLFEIRATETETFAVLATFSRRTICPHTSPTGRT